MASYTHYNPVANGEFITTRYVAVDNGPRYVTSVSNMLGQGVRSVRPALNGTTAATVTTTNHYQTGTGYLLRVSTDAANVPDTVMEYNTIGVLTRRGQSQDATLTLASDDRVTDVETGVESSGGDLWSVQRSTTYPDAGSATGRLLGISRSQVAGFSGDVVAYNEGTDINGNTSWSRTELSLLTQAPTGVTTTTAKAASNTASSVTVAYHGRTESVAIPGVTGLTTYTYDALGRNIRVQDPRHTNYSETVYYGKRPTRHP